MFGFGNKEDKLNQKIVDGHAEISDLEQRAAEASGGQRDRLKRKADNMAAYVASLEQELYELQQERRDG